MCRSIALLFTLFFLTGCEDPDGICDGNTLIVRLPDDEPNGDGRYRPEPRYDRISCGSLTCVERKGIAACVDARRIRCEHDQCLDGKKATCSATGYLGEPDAYDKPGYVCAEGKEGEPIWVADPLEPCNGKHAVCEASGLLKRCVEAAGYFDRPTAAFDDEICQETADGEAGFVALPPTPCVEGQERCSDSGRTVQGCDLVTGHYQVIQRCSRGSVCGLGEQTLDCVPL